MKPKVRSAKVVGRTQDVLDFLEANGPSTLAAICAGTHLPLHIARYATVLLHQDGLSHISQFERIQRHGDRIPRHVAIFSAGAGTNAQLRNSLADDAKLDWETGSHLQATYVQWAQTRRPDDLEDAS